MNEVEPASWPVLFVGLYLIAVMHAFRLSFRAAPGRRFWRACTVLLGLGTAFASAGAFFAPVMDLVPPAFTLGLWCVVAGMVGTYAGMLAQLLRRLLGRWTTTE